MLVLWGRHSRRGCRSTDRTFFIQLSVQNRTYGRRNVPLSFSPLYSLRLKPSKETRSRLKKMQVYSPSQLVHWFWKDPYSIQKVPSVFLGCICSSAYVYQQRQLDAIGFQPCIKSSPRRRGEEGKKNVYHF